MFSQANRLLAYQTNMKADPKVVLTYCLEYLLFVAPYSSGMRAQRSTSSVGAVLGSWEMVMMCFMFHFFFFMFLSFLHVFNMSVKQNTQCFQYTEIACMKGIFMHTKLSHLRHSWLTPCSRLYSFKLNEVMENWPKFSYLVGKWDKYSHVHLYFWEEPLGSCSLQTVKGEQIFPPSEAFPELPVRQLLLFKQQKHFHHLFISIWNSASWTARDSRVPEMTAGSTPLGTGRQDLPWDSGRQEGMMVANCTLWKNISTYHTTGRAKPDILIAW